MVVPFPVPGKHLETLLEAFGVAEAGARAGLTGYGVYPVDLDGLVWAIPEGLRIPEQAVALFCNDCVQDVDLVRPPALPDPPLFGVWEVPLADWDRVGGATVT